MVIEFLQPKYFAMIKSLVLMIIIGGATLTTAQSFDTYVSNDTILIGNDVLVKFTLENIDGRFTPPDFEDFKIISGPNKSSSVSIINGDKTSKTTYVYYLRPEREGQIEILPIGVEHDEETIYSDTLNFIVEPNPDNIIIIPEDESNEFGSSFFELRSFPFGNREDKSLQKPKEKEKKSKRKYKRI